MIHHILTLVLNQRGRTLDAIRSMLAQDVPVEVWVITQGCIAGEREALVGMASRHPNLHVTSMDHNIGVSAGWNHGLRFLLDRLDVPCVLVLNNDVVLRPDTMRTLVADGGPFVTAVGTDDPSLAFCPTVALRHDPHPDFSCFLITRETWRRVGEFDERLFAYCGDGDYHLRMHRAGVTALNTSLPYFHMVSGTIKAMDTSQSQWLRDRADLDRAAFRAKWGCDMDDPAYMAMFTSGEPERRGASS